MSYVSGSEGPSVSGFDVQGPAPLPSDWTTSMNSQFQFFNALDSDPWGAGAISTGPGNKAYRSTDPKTGLITTVLQIDLTGLAVKGDAAHDVIGLAAGGAAYIYRNVVADNGVLFKYTVTCVELPTEETATITTDIDLTWNSNGTRIYDYGLGAETHNLGTLVAGEHFTSAQDPNLTADDYLYLVEGDNAATTGEYSGGQYVFTFYGWSVR